MDNMTTGEETMNVLISHINGCCGYNEGECEKCTLNKMEIAKGVTYCDAMYFLSNKLIVDMRLQNGDKFDEDDKCFAETTNSDFNTMFQK